MRAPFVIAAPLFAAALVACPDKPAEGPNTVTTVEAGAEAPIPEGVDGGPVLDAPPRAAIANAAKPAHIEIENCYNAGLKRTPGLTGRVVMILSISPEGAVTKIEDGGSTMPDKEVTDCVFAVMKKVQFPKYPKSYEAGMPFTLVPTDKMRKP